MADIDLLPTRGVPFRALVDSSGVAINGSQTVAQLASRGVRAFCAVDGTGTPITGGGSLAGLAAAGIRAFCAVDENGVAQDASTALQLRSRGIRPMVLLDASGIALNGSANMLALAQKGLDYCCPVDESGNATTMGAVILISNTNVFDNIAVGATVGTLSVAGGTGTYTFSLTSNPGSLFVTAGTNGVNLNTAAALTAGSKPVTVQAAGGVPTPISRALSITVAQSPTPPVNTALPVISGTTTVGQTLTSTGDTWTGFPTPTYAYQWKRGGSAISGATASSYLLVSADAGATITVTVTATNTAGSASATSAGVGPIAAAPTAPANTVLPAVSGALSVGSVLTASSGTWTGTATITYAYQWQRGGSDISGATASSYTLVTADLAAMMTVVVTATNSVGNASANSAAVGPVIALPAYTQAAKRNFLSEGDSLSAVASVMLSASYAAIPGYQTKAIVAVSGATLGDVISRASATDAHLVSGALNVMSLLIGANSMSDPAQYPTVNDFLTALAGYCDARRTAGWYVLLYTLLPMGASGGVNAFNTQRAVANPEMKLWATSGSIVPGKHADQIFDLGSDPIMGPDNSQQANPTYWSGDGVHPTQLGYDRMIAISKVPIGGASAASVTRVQPPSVTRVLWLTPTREAGGPYKTLIATAPNCSWTLLGGSDPGFTLTGTTANSASTYVGPVDTLNHPAGSVGTFVANLRGVDSFGNIYTPVVTLTVTPVNSTLNIAPNGGRFDTYHVNELADTTADGSEAYGIEEINGNPVFYLTAVTGAAFTQIGIGNGGATVSGTYEWSFLTWKDRPGTTAPMGIQGADSNFITLAGYVPPTTPGLVQGTYTQSAQSAITNMIYYFNAPSGIVVGEKAWLDDFELRQVLGPVITKGVFAPSGPTTARVSVTTPATTGTMYAVITPRPNRPTKAQIKAGQDELGGTPLGVGSTVVTAAQAYTVDVSGLTPATNYYAHFVHQTASGYSNTMWAGGTTRATAPTTWSPVNKGAAIVLSNGNKTVDRSSSGSFWQTVVSVDGVASGTHSFKVTFGGTSLVAWEIGVINTGSSQFFDFGDSGGILGGDPSYSFGYVYNNTIIPGGLASGIIAPVLGDTIEFVIDANLKRIRVRNVTQAAGTYSAWFDMSSQPFWNFANNGSAGGANIYAIVGLQAISTPTITADFTGWGV